MITTSKEIPEIVRLQLEAIFVMAEYRKTIHS
jgi:hypothetical protein